MFANGMIISYEFQSHAPTCDTLPQKLIQVYSQSITC